MNDLKVVCFEWLSSGRPKSRKGEVSALTLSFADTEESIEESILTPHTADLNGSVWIFGLMRCICTGLLHSYYHSILW